MKINWKVRAKNPYFWIGLLGVVLTASGIHPESLTSWSVFTTQLMAVLNNPYQLGAIVLALLGVITDPTTQGISDSTAALTYTDPKK